jgi:SAM-dependent methyltransferase
MKGNAKISLLPYKIGLLPFFFKPLSQPTNGDDLPDFLPFSVDVDLKTGTLVQCPDAYVSRAISKAYKKGSELSGMMDSSGIGKEYAEDFVVFLKNTLGVDTFNGFKVLEIGCGTGFLLSLLKNLGADVLGIEPGQHGQEKRFDVPIIHDFFPSTKIDGKYHLIILYGVLEHIEDTDTFLKKVSEHLFNDGKIVIAVPNCQPYIYSGDTSMLLHEHWWYYTKETLYNTVTRAINTNVCISDSNFGGVLYAITTDPLFQQAYVKDMGKHIAETEAFCSRIQRSLNIVTQMLEDAYLKDEEIGIFVPGRAINILSMIKSKEYLQKIRFFNDDPRLQYTYYPGFPHIIESRKDLIENPPESILIFSRTFGHKIKMELSIDLPLSKIFLWEDLFDQCDPVRDE